MPMIFASLTFLHIAIWSYMLMTPLSISLFHILLSSLVCVCVFFFFFTSHVSDLFSLTGGWRAFVCLFVCFQKTSMSPPRISNGAPLIGWWSKWSNLWEGHPYPFQIWVPPRHHIEKSIYIFWKHILRVTTGCNFSVSYIVLLPWIINFDILKTRKGLTTRCILRIGHNVLLPCIQTWLPEKPIFFFFFFFFSFAKKS